jgi:hypothetical protein
MFFVKFVKKSFNTVYEWKFEETKNRKNTAN